MANDENNPEADKSGPLERWALALDSMLDKFWFWIINLKDNITSSSTKSEGPSQRVGAFNSGITGESEEITPPNKQKRLGKLPMSDSSSDPKDKAAGAIRGLSSTLVIIALGAIFFFVPFLECEKCGGDGDIWWSTGNCSTCGGRGHQTLWQEVRTKFEDKIRR